MEVQQRSSMTNAPKKAKLTRSSPKSKKVSQERRSSRSVSPGLFSVSVTDSELSSLGDSMDSDSDAGTTVSAEELQIDEPLNLNPHQLQSVFYSKEEEDEQDEATDLNCSIATCLELPGLLDHMDMEALQGHCKENENDDALDSWIEALPF